MTLSTIINIAITLIFIYLASSFIIFAIQEKIILFFNLKAKNLKQVIYGLLGEEQQKGSFSLTERFYEKYLNLPLNPSLSSKRQQEKGGKLQAGKLSKSMGPEQIPAEQFVADLITVVAEELKYEDKDFYNKYELTKIIEDINGSDCRFSEKMKRDLSAMLQRAINRFEDKGEQLKYLDKQLQSWYDMSIEYALEIYDKKRQYISIILSVIVVLMFNIDTVNIIDNLSKSEITSTLSNKITEVIVSNSESNSCSQVNEDTEFQTCIQEQFATTFMALDGIDNLPIGWNFSEPLKEQFTPLNFPHIIKAITGWIISIIAISQGAPFWFGILNNLINFKSNKSAKN
ncbi:MAG: hypothetical protein F6K25_24970 [Okeania sp. SIO2G4]|uniref:hypothetical protein n=1 Tax=unclassified Okeania TaxID=2634635 RepID=UPI0013B787C7|nr:MULTISPECIES: hypothetical protein [unclassified Okeania]NEP39212.1 hypothetical protein [Okeania sp. SIO2H7]NEP74909.1 hypothetical protein [Okeania sp. SIO2G5]NEP95994.1 hypothetical protein [Okeania sp. SIO2F5]NEQ93728.1 hypothetical protein [Okeania sp. SIO2G4]